MASSFGGEIHRVRTGRKLKTGVCSQGHRLAEGQTARDLNKDADKRIGVSEVRSTRCLNNS